MMLAGLLFAIHDSEDRPDRLAATAPFGGVTLIEYQARLLVAAGVAQIIIVVSRLTPELLGAVGRIGRRGIAVDAVRSATEATEKLHPLASVLVLADGLVTTEAVVSMLARDGGDALLVTPEGDAGGGFERVGGGMTWAGIARIDARRMVEVAALPRDYDLQSTIIRVAAQARATHILLPQEALRHGHGIEHRGAALEARGRTILAAMVSNRRGWFDRYVIAPIARRALPTLVSRAVPGSAVGAIGGVLGLGGLAALAFDFYAAGMLLTLAGGIALSLGATLGMLRDEEGLARLHGAGAALLPALAILMLGRGGAALAAENGAFALAVALVVIAGLGERAIPARVRRLWWGSPAAYLAIVTLAVLFGAPVGGMLIAAIYATATAASAIEALREQP